MHVNEEDKYLTQILEPALLVVKTVDAIRYREEPTKTTQKEGPDTSSNPTNLTASCTTVHRFEAVHRLYRWSCSCDPCTKATAYERQPRTGGELLCTAQYLTTSIASHLTDRTKNVSMLSSSSILVADDTPCSVPNRIFDDCNVLTRQLDDQIYGLVQQNCQQCQMVAEYCSSGGRLGAYPRT